MNERARLTPGGSEDAILEEIRDLISEATDLCIIADADGPLEMCMAEPPGRVAGPPVFCKLVADHNPMIKHRDPETRFAWWGEK